MKTKTKYFKVQLETVECIDTYMVRCDKVSEFFNNKIDYLEHDCKITVLGRFTETNTKNWYRLSSWVIID